jgi:hypothetical protein
MKLQFLEIQAVENVLILRWVGHVAHMGEMRYAYKITVGIP